MQIVDAKTVEKPNIVIIYADDLGEQNNVASANPRIVNELSKLLKEFKKKGFQTQEEFKLR